MVETPLDLEGIRSHFFFPKVGRIVTNNAASTQPPHDLLELLADLAPGYENVHRGQSDASKEMTRLFEDSWDTIAAFLGASGRDCLALYRGTTEAINSVMYMLLTEFRDGDNLVTTMLEHNSNYVPWHALCREILPRLGVHVECRVVPFDIATGELDMQTLAEFVDDRTKLICCTGASNFLGTKLPLEAVRAIADGSGYQQPNGEVRSWLLVDGAQLVPSGPIDVNTLGADFMAFSFHKMLAPFGVGLLYARPELLQTLPPFLYGGDMIAEGQVFPDHVEYQDLPWKYAAGTPNIVGTILSAQTLRLILDLANDPNHQVWFRSEDELTHGDAMAAMARVAAHLQAVTGYALERMTAVPGATIYGPRDPKRRAGLVSFNLRGRDPFAVAEGLNAAGVESRAGCHCATLAHHHLKLDPPASCRISFAVYTSFEDVDRAVDALEMVAAS